MKNIFSLTAKLLSFNLKTSPTTYKDNNTYGASLTSLPASLVTRGDSGMSTESNVTYRVYNNES